MSSVSDVFVERLIAWGVRRVYGYPGDGISGIIGAMHRAQDRIEFVQVAHEELRPSPRRPTPSSPVSWASIYRRVDRGPSTC